MIDRDGHSGLGLPVLPEDCTVLSVAAAGDRVWAATDAGLWQRCGASWRPVTVPLAAPIVSAIVRAGTADDPGSALLVAGLAGGLLCSADDGEHWYAAWVDEIASSVSCFAISPRFAVDRVVLAGTERDGILRSTDGGRHWRLANFGLAGYTILALATPLSWGRREAVFAATDEGIYRSPNAGRAWQRANEGPEAVTQTLAVSPQFALDRTLYAGGEETGLYRSIDSGRSWQLWSTGIRDVNCLWLAPDNPRL